MDIQEICKNKILVIDGAMGTMLQSYKLKEEDFRTTDLQDHKLPLYGNNDLLSLSRPEIVSEVHRAYLEAGADILETNTFCSTSIAQADYGLEHLSYKLNFESAKIAKNLCLEYNQNDPSKPRFVAGSMGPTNKTASLSPDVNRPEFRSVSFQELVDSYIVQCQGLMDGGADLLLVETIFDTLNAKAALFAIETVFEEKGNSLPIMVSGTITDASGRTLSGQTAEAFLISVCHAPIFSIGFNCALGAKDLLPYLQVLNSKAPFLISAHPNAGLPNQFGEYDQGPKEMSEEIKTYLELGLINIVGGCCGTSPEHISEIAKLVKNYSPRNIDLVNP